MKFQKLKVVIAAACVALGIISGCVTDKKQPEDDQFLRAQPEVPGGPVATKVTLRCNVQNPKTKKSVPCKETSVKITGLSNKTVTTETFKGGVGSLTVGRDVYAMDVTTSHCSIVRNLKGMMAGMAVEVFFPPPCGTK